MAKYKKKDPTFDCVQWVPNLKHPKVFSTKTHGIFLTKSGRQVVKPGDWIVTNEDGGVEIHSDDHFKKNYEAMPSAPPKK